MISNSGILVIGCVGAEIFVYLSLRAFGRKSSSASSIVLPAFLLEISAYHSVKVRIMHSQWLQSRDFKLYILSGDRGTPQPENGPTSSV